MYTLDNDDDVILMMEMIDLSSIIGLQYVTHYPTEVCLTCCILYSV